MSHQQLQARPHLVALAHSLAQRFKTIGRQLQRRQINDTRAQQIELHLRAAEAALQEAEKLSGVAQ